MMNNTGWNTGFVFLWGLHVLSMIAFSIGLIFLVVWAIKHLHEKQLKSWGIGLVIVGILACLLTIGVKGSPWMGYGMGGLGYARMMPMMGFDDDDNGSSRGMMMQGMMENGMGMSMMLRGKTGDDFDRAFIQLMIPHHQDAIIMANMALKDAKHDEMKNLARDIISAQQREIDKMKEWQRSWGYAQ
ncbi:MAG: DUF305 domain-containing protein [Candidatus Peregrinibacteria bacterium]|nr:DUF305 domain-containing protein [Candidatus Peregrinibacteria bacterium]